jgi:hypothetical protein
MGNQQANFYNLEYEDSGFSDVAANSLESSYNHFLFRSNTSQSSTPLKSQFKFQNLIETENNEQIYEEFQQKNSTSNNNNSSSTAPRRPSLIKSVSIGITQNLSQAQDFELNNNLDYEDAEDEAENEDYLGNCQCEKCNNDAANSNANKQFLSVSE